MAADLDPTKSLRYGSRCMKQHLLSKIWDLHRIRTLPSGQDQIFIGLHLIHEVTSPQAFGMLKDRGLEILFPRRTFATVDHIVPTDDQTRPFADSLAEAMIQAVEANTREHGVALFDLGSDTQGIVHIVGPELGLTQPGMTVVCGDSHTSTHGAVGALAFGIGTTQIRDVLATQTLAMRKPRVRRVNVTGTLDQGVSAKDIILKIIAELGVNGGIGYAYEFGGSVIETLDMESRLTICNMSIEGGARAGYVNPDAITFEYLRGKRYAPDDNAFPRAIEFWKQIASDPDADYDDEYELCVDELEPQVAWGINPGQTVGVSEKIPRLAQVQPEARDLVRRALDHTGFTEGQPIQGTAIDVAFIGSCTNGRISDLRQAARVLRGRKVARSVRTLVVPGSKQVAAQADSEGLPEVFLRAGCEWRKAGCSLCLAMNPDKLSGRQVCASSSNRNFIGRQGTPSGRTLLMSPAMVAAAALSGEVSDVRTML